MKRFILPLLRISCLASLIAFTYSCDKDDDAAPEEENELEVITDVQLIFTNTADAADVVTASAKDPDGEGIKELEILGDINLDTSKTYTLTFSVWNNLDSPGDDIGKEIEEEDHEHQIFFACSNNAFSNPTGDGNIDNASDPIVYNDMDENQNPVGLSTTWTTSSTTLSGGEFRVRLQHQDDGIKTADSGAQDGDTDFDLTFVLNIN